jgi:hypothetical protein
MRFGRKSTGAGAALTHGLLCIKQPAVDVGRPSVLSYLTLMKTFTPLYFVSHCMRVAVRGRVSSGMYGETCG